MIFLRQVLLFSQYVQLLLHVGVFGNINWFLKECGHFLLELALKEKQYEELLHIAYSAVF